MKNLIGALNADKVEDKESTDLAAIGDLVKAIDEHIESGIKPRFRKSTGFGPSEHNTCVRFWWYKFHGVEFPVNHNARLQRIFDTGHSVHERIVSYFDGMGVLMAVEEPVPQREGCPPISAYIDAIIDWDGPVVVEIKSTNHEGFAMRQHFKKPTEDHMRQIQWYLHYKNLDRGLVIYENKNNQEILVFKVKRDIEFCEKQMKKYAKIYSKAIGPKPDRPYKRSSPKCQGCKLLTVCWAESESNEGETV
jgi:CRISPR/Cas system-associated exonuclease Cas4 (RecB family)